jgi:hypothetical protein
LANASAQTLSSVSPHANPSSEMKYSTGAAFSRRLFFSLKQNRRFV